MTSGTFVRVDKPGQDGRKASKHGRGVFFNPEDDRESYEFNAKESAGMGTKVPSTLEHGGTPKNGVFGVITLGKVYRNVNGEAVAVDEERALADLLERKETGMTTQKAPEGNIQELRLDDATEASLQAEQERAEISRQEILAKGAEAEAAGRKAYAARAKAEKRRKKPVLSTEEVPVEALDMAALVEELAAAQALDTPKEVPDVYIPFRISGDFGSYRGKALEIIRDGNIVVILSRPTDPVYSPPAGKDPIILAAENISCNVIAVGIEFVLTRQNLFVQVFLSSE